MATTIKAAGVVLVRSSKAKGVEIAVVHRPRQDDWSLPKGKLDDGELLPLCAWRETFEETGYKVILGPHVRQQRYRVDGRPKTVDYWIGRMLPRGKFVPNREVDKLEWLAPTKARSRLTYPRDRSLVTTALKLPRTSPLIILRHTQAMKRSDYKGNKDWRRPLAKQGRKEASALVPLLRAYGITEVHSSDARRCVQTVTPYATKVRVPVDIEPLFSEELFERRPKTSVRLLRSVARRPAPLVICTHRPVLPAMLDELASQFTIKGNGRLLNPNLAPGGIIILHRGLTPRGRLSGEVLGIERYDR